MHNILHIGFATKLTATLPCASDLVLSTGFGVVIEQTPVPKTDA